MSQADQILQALQDGQRISAIDALEVFGCLRLAARIHDLRKGGHDIKDMIHCGDGGKRYAVYYIPATNRGQDNGRNG